MPWRSAFEIDVERLLDRIRDTLVSTDALLPVGIRLPYEPGPAFGAVMVLGFMLVVTSMLGYSSVYRKLWLNSWYQIHGAARDRTGHTLATSPGVIGPALSLSSPQVATSTCPGALPPRRACRRSCL